MRKDIVVRVTVAAVAAAGVWLAWTQNQPQPLTMEKASENVYVIIGDGGNVAFMPTREGVIVVDDKFAADAPQIVAKIKSVTDRPIRYVLNTHQHGDHTGGNEAMMTARAEIIIQKNARANMVTGKQPGLPNITFTDESQVFLGGQEVVARHLGRGHTNGDAVIYFPSEKVLHTGDLFVSTGAPFCDTDNGGSIKEWPATLQKILAYDFDTVSVYQQPFHLRRQVFGLRQDGGFQLRMVAHPGIERAHAAHRGVQMRRTARRQCARRFPRRSPRKRNLRAPQSRGWSSTPRRDGSQS
jgi:glyoxylase-like metal-dependent hydrolase (beta-lactamase superfamily II)